MIWGILGLLVGLVALLGSCSQVSFDDPLGSYDGRGAQETLRSPHPVRFSIEAVLGSIGDEPRQEGRFLEFGGVTRDSVAALDIRAVADGGEEVFGGSDVGLGRREMGNSVYPMVRGKVSYGPAHDPISYDVSYRDQGLETHTFIYAYNEASDRYQLVGYAKLSWGMKQGVHRVTTAQYRDSVDYRGRGYRREGSSFYDVDQSVTYTHYRTFLKTENVADVHKASYNADQSEMIISEDEFISLEQGKRYRILAINDDGGFDPKRASLADYPEAAAPMFYFAKGGNSPLPAATAFKLEGSDFPDQSGIVAYGLELDYTPDEPNFVHLGESQRAEFRPLSPVLQLRIPANFEGYRENLGRSLTLADISHNPTVLASSCLTQNFAYTISGVGESGAKPHFKTILRELQAEGYALAGSPLEGTTYEPLLIPFVTRDKTIYLPLEPRYRSLNSREDKATFIVPQTGERIQGDLLADGDLYFKQYLRDPHTEALYVPSALTKAGDWAIARIDQVYYLKYPVSGYRMGQWGSFAIPQNPGRRGKDVRGLTSVRFGFNLALAKGGTTRDQAEAVEVFWRNDPEKNRYNMNRLEIQGMRVRAYTPPPPGGELL